jgi:hypothetical protein
MLLKRELAGVPIQSLPPHIGQAGKGRVVMIP